MRRTALSIALVLALTVNANAEDKVNLKRKPGLWEISASADGHAMPMAMKQCADEDSDAQMMQIAQVRSDSCKVSGFTKTASGYEFSSECEVNGSKMTSSGVFTGDFQSKYKGEIVTKISPPIFGKESSNTILEAKWIGPCPEGMKAGDMEMENGMRINLEQAKQGAKMAAEMMKNPDMLKAMKNAMAGANPEVAEALKNLPGANQ